MHLLSPSANNGSRIIKSLFPSKDDRPQLVICYYVMINSDKINLYLLNRIINCESSTSHSKQKTS